MSTTYIENITKEMQEHMFFRNYSKHSITAYMFHVRAFYNYCVSTTESDREKRIIGYINQCPQSSRAVARSSLKYLYTQILNIPVSILNITVRHSKKLPPVFSRDEVLRLLEAITNSKHRLIISMLYGSGLRVSEVINVKVGDIYLERQKIHIRQAKNKKDRIVVLSSTLISQIKDHIRDRKPKEWLFLNQSGKKYSVRTVQAIFKRALQKTGFSRQASCHSLRHSFATTLLESGVDIRLIQAQLGHSSLKTTMHYTRITGAIADKLQSPL